LIITYALNYVYTALLANSQLLTRQ